jgi:hypothetical protein
MRHAEHARFHQGRWIVHVHGVFAEVLLSEIVSCRPMTDLNQR